VSTPSTIFIARLNAEVTDQQLLDFLGQWARVVKVKIVRDRETLRSRGFAFVSTFSPADDEALLALDGYEFRGRALRVQRAKSKSEVHK